MNNNEVVNVRRAFESILRSDYIAINEIAQLQNLSQYYVDSYNNVPNILQEQDNFVCGRRGTGKTALLLRAYYECLKTISPKIKDEKCILGSRKVLPIYIDLSQCKEILEDDKEGVFERNFLKRLVEELREQLDFMFEEASFKLFKKNTSMLNEFEYIERLLLEGMLVHREDKGVQLSEKQLMEAEIGCAVDLKGIGINGKQTEKCEQEVNKTVEEVRGINVRDFLANISRIRKNSGLDAIYVFLDEFSDLTTEEQNRFSILFKKLLGSKINLFFKVGTITDRYDFGEQIIIGRDIFPVSLDLNEFVERHGGIVSAIKVMEKFTEQLILKRIEIFSSETKFNQIFKVNKDEMLSRITREAMGVPRTIGLILQNALGQAEGRTNENRIMMSDINYGMRAARKVYFKQFQGAVKNRLIPGYHMDIWNSILGKALEEKIKHSKRPASHILLDPVRKSYLNILCENFIVHLIEESRTSKYGGSYLLYAIDYDICMENNIQYAEEKDEFTAARFIYDSVLSEYDGYFMKDRIRSYRCPECGIIYEEKDVADFKVKRCKEDDAKLEEIIHRDSPKTEGNYTEVEIKILGLIATLGKEDAMPAVDIAGAVGCSVYKVANWCSKVLKKKNLIEIEKRCGKNYYYDKNTMEIDMV